MVQHGKFIFITGGARSGKSSYAEKLAGEIGQSVVYIATCVPLDEEMLERVKKHRERRPPEWITVEEQKDAAAVIKKEGEKTDVILLDCLTLLVTNLYLEKKNETKSYEDVEASILKIISNIAEISQKVSATVIIVSNETGMGLVPDNAAGREFRDILGRANQIMARHASEVYFTVAGIPVLIKGGVRCRQKQ